MGWGESPVFIYQDPVQTQVLEMTLEGSKGSKNIGLMIAKFFYITTWFLSVDVEAKVRQ